MAKSVSCLGFAASIVGCFATKFVRFATEYEKEQVAVDKEKVSRLAVLSKDCKITVRSMQTTDVADIIRIWCDGLSQTGMAFKWYSPLRYMLGKGLKQLEKSATEKGGDMNFDSITSEWTGHESTGKKMFVATATATDGPGKGKEIVVGLCGVSRGATQQGDDKDDTIPPNTFSLWRVSVSPNARGKGLGKLLTEEAEFFAKSSGGETMRCITANLVAYRLYKKLGFSEVPASSIGQSLSFWRWVAPWLQKDLI